MNIGETSFLKEEKLALFIQNEKTHFLGANTHQCRRAAEKTIEQIADPTCADDDPTLADEIRPKLSEAIA